MRPKPRMGSWAAAEIDKHALCTAYKKTIFLAILPGRSKSELDASLAHSIGKSKNTGESA